MHFVGEFHSDSRRDIVVDPFNITKEEVRFPDSSITGKDYYWTWEEWTYFYRNDQNVGCQNDFYADLFMEPLFYY